MCVQAGGVDLCAAAQAHLVELGYTSIPVSDSALCERNRERVLGCTAGSPGRCVSTHVCPTREGESEAD